MGTVISFYDENGSGLGHVNFSGFSARRQTYAYGVCWHDCVIWIHPKMGEVYGPPDEDSDPDNPGPYTPDWDLCLERARKMLEGAQATDNEQRRAYDLQEHTVPKLVGLLELCAANPHRDRCTISIG